MSRTPLLALALLLSACAPTATTSVPVVALSGAVPPEPDTPETQDQASWLTTQDQAYQAFARAGANMRLAENWNPFKSVDSLSNSLIWEATSKDGTRTVRTKVILVTVSDSTRIQFTTKGIAPAAANAFHKWLFNEARKQL